MDKIRLIKIAASVCVYMQGFENAIHCKYRNVLIPLRNSVDSNTIAMIGFEVFKIKKNK